jgi:hypothetical protein
MRWRKAPFGPALDEFARRLAQNKGYLKLLDGARVRFDEWEAAGCPGRSGSGRAPSTADGAVLARGGAQAQGEPEAPVAQRRCGERACARR